MPNWAFVVADTDGTHRSDWVRARGRSITWDLYGPAVAEWESDGDDPGAMAADEISSDLMAYRDGALMFRGRMGSTTDEIDENRHVVKWGSVGYRGLLWRRNVFFAAGGTGVEQTAIGWALIVNAQVPLLDGDMGITDASTATGRLRDRGYKHGKNIGEAIQQLSEVIDGFDWDITPELEYVTWYPQRGTTVDWAAVHGDSVARVTRGVNTGDYATDIYAFGATDEDTGWVLQTTSFAPTPHGPGGRWDGVYTNSSVSDPATLQEQSDAERLRRSVITPSYECVVRPGAWTPDDAWLGDITPLVIRSGRLDVNTTGRIVAIKIDIGENDEETVTLTYDRRPPSLDDRLKSITRLLDDLNLR